MSEQEKKYSPGQRELRGIIGTAERLDQKGMGGFPKDFALGIMRKALVVPGKMPDKGKHDLFIQGDGQRGEADALQQIFVTNDAVKNFRPIFYALLRIGQVVEVQRCTAQHDARSQQKGFHLKRAVNIGNVAFHEAQVVSIQKAFFVNGAPD